MARIELDAEPKEVGLDAERLARIDRHFARYVDEGFLPGWLIAVTRRGRIAHLSTYGARDLETAAPVTDDTVFRIYSMTKPITSVAAMMLYEEGAFELKDPVSRFIPSFADARVFRSGSSLAPLTEPVTEPVRMWHLLTHTSGLTYGFHYNHPVDALYRAAGFEWSTPPGADLAECCDRWAALPLRFQPGSGWSYSVSTDVLGRVVEVIAGLPLDEVLATRIFEPLGMRDTAFVAKGDALDRLATLYRPDPVTRRPVPFPEMGDAARHAPAMLSGGGGLVSSAYDYHRFTQMLLGGGAVQATRLLGSRTVAYMTQNHLPGGVDLEAIGQSTFAESSFDGVGFGLGFSVALDPVASRVLSGPGEFGWGGAASTAFFVDPREELTVLFLTQLLPSSAHPIRPQLRRLVYQALVD
jgi:CubicO group peptidase (beta-lactamase class C family)